MLSPEELGRRIKAAREIRGLSQVQLNDLFDADGLDKTAPGRIERGEITMLRAHREALQHHLRVPEAWLTSDDVDQIVGLTDRPETIISRLDRLERDNAERYVSLQERMESELRRLVVEAAAREERLREIAFAASTREMAMQQLIEEAAEAIRQFRSQQQR